MVTPLSALLNTAAKASQCEQFVFRWTPNSQPHAIRPRGNVSRHLHPPLRIDESQHIRRLAIQGIITVEADLVTGVQKMDENRPAGASLAYVPLQIQKQPAWRFAL